MISNVYESFYFFSDIKSSKHLKIENKSHFFIHSNVSTFGRLLFRIIRITFQVNIHFSNSLISGSTDVPTKRNIILETKKH